MLIASPSPRLGLTQVCRSQGGMVWNLPHQVGITDREGCVGSAMLDA